MKESSQRMDSITAQPITAQMTPKTTKKPVPGKLLNILTLL
ncbi:hypothetical protein ECW26_47970 [Escherichia coli W26]|nr:hypothetical protein ECW26_47970 [Escherichia coli W26]